MHLQFDAGQLTIVADDPTEREQLTLWATVADGHLFALARTGSDTLALRDAGASADVRREPINITFDTTPMPLQLISNLAETPFLLDGRWYASIEGFWQGLKYENDQTRVAIAKLAGHPAKAAGNSAPASDIISYAGRDVRVGTYGHWALMARANRAKFEQHEPARAALLSTGTRPLEHRVARDSRTIPGVIMASIWIRLRTALAASPGSAPAGQTRFRPDRLP